MAKQASLAATSGALSTGNFQLPAVFAPPSAPLEARQMNPYIVFAHPNKKDEWAKLVAKFGSVSDGDVFLIEPNLITPLGTFKASIFTYRKYYAKTNAAGDTLATSAKETPECGKETVEAVLLAYLADRCVPANVTFKTTKCGGAIALSEALVEASDPKWAAKSQAHKETLICTEPFMRFYGELTCQPPRTSKRSGMPYRPLTCNDVKPTGATEWKLLKELFDDPRTAELMQLAAARYTKQLAEVDAKMPKPQVAA